MIQTNGFDARGAASTTARRPPKRYTRPMDETTRYDGSTGDKSSATHSHTESDPRTLRDGPSITKLRQDVDNLDDLMLEVLERLGDLEAEAKRAEALSKKVERLEARLNGLETEDRQPNAQVIDPNDDTGGSADFVDADDLDELGYDDSSATDGPWGAANGAAERAGESR